MKKAISALFLAIAVICCSPKARAQQPLGFGYRLNDEFSIPLNMAVGSLINYGLYKNIRSGYDDDDLKEYGEKKIKKACLAQSMFLTAFLVTLFVPAIEYQIGDSEVNRREAEMFWKNQIATWGSIGLSGFFIYRWDF